MKSTGLMCVTTTVLFALLAIPATLAAQEQTEKQQPLHDNLTTYLDRANDQPEDINNEEGPEASAFFLRDLELPASNAAIADPNVACPNCSTKNTLTGYCVGTNVEVCSYAQDVAACPVGKPAIKPGWKVFFCPHPPQNLTVYVDLSRGCHVHTRLGEIYGACGVNQK